MRVVLVGDGRPHTIENGEFLDVTSTNSYKASQVMDFADRVQAKDVQDGDTVLFLDGWHPGVLQVAYMRDALGLRLRLVSMVHAGTWDQYDFLTRVGMRRWAKDAERGMLRAVDAVCVATNFHRRMISDYFGSECGELRVVPFPLFRSRFIDHFTAWEARPRRVVFPHRLAPEKDPEFFADVESRYRREYPEDVSVEFVRTKDVCSSKQDYYALLGNSRVAFSSALQETWGIAMLEAAHLGCWPVLPNRLSYPEVHTVGCLYDDAATAVALIRKCLDAPAPHVRESHADEAMRSIASVCLEKQ